MPTTVTVKWNASAIRERVAVAVVDGLERVAQEAHTVWEDIAPVGDDPRTSGDLRRMFRAPIIGGEVNVALILNAYAKHAVHVEYGTYKDPVQAPLRRTAGQVIPSIGRHIKAALMEL